MEGNSVWDAWKNSSVLNEICRNDSSISCDFSRSVRTGDFNTYVLSIPKITNHFFDLSQPNYARWLVKYHNSLLEAPYAHPEVYQEFRKGMFGIKRNPIDLAL